jgi:hypothetical protein
MIFLMRRIVPLCVVALVLTGCGDDPPAAGAGPATEAPAASSPAPSSPASSPSAPAVPACQSPKTWSERQVGNWVKAMVQSEGSDEITFRRTGSVAPLCEAVQVQVEFWDVHFTTFVVDRSFTMTSKLRKQVKLDGRREVVVAGPKNFAPSDCSGTVLAAYPGKPLTKEELPSSLEFPEGSAEPEVEFETDRIAYVNPAMPPADSTGRYLGTCR